jgi:hypothetical protein
MKRVYLAALAAAVIGGSIGCEDYAARGNKGNTVSTVAGTVVNLKVPNMT